MTATILALTVALGALAEFGDLALALAAALELGARALLMGRILLALEPVTTTLVATGILALGILAFKPKKKKKKKPIATESKCPPFPPLDLEAVKDAVAEGLEAKVAGLSAMTSFVAYKLFPKYPDGTAAKWPKEPPYLWGAEFDGAAVCRWEEIRSVLEELDIPVVVDDPIEVIGELILDYPLPGHFYFTKKGDTLSQLVRKALNNFFAGAGEDNQTRLAYIKQCMNVGEKWNKKLYGSSRTSTLFPAYYLTNGSGLAAAFLPRNADVIAAVSQKLMPKRTIMPNGAAIAGSGATKYGLLWFPPVSRDDLEQNGTVTCAPLVHSDGSSSVDPPPELLELLAA